METPALKWVMRDVNMQRPINIKHVKQSRMCTAQNKLVPVTVRRGDRWSGLGRDAAMPYRSSH